MTIPQHLPVDFVSRAVMMSRPHYEYLAELQDRITSGTWGIGFGHCFHCATNEKKCVRCQKLHDDALHAEKERKKHFYIEHIPNGVFLTFD